MRRFLPALPLLLASLATPTAAAPRDWLDLALSHDQLNNGGADWEGLQLAYLHHLNDKQTLSLQIEQQRRYQLQDRQWGLQYAHQFQAGQSLSLSLDASPGHQFLPRRQLGASLQLPLSNAWFAHLGLRQRAYQNSAGSSNTMSWQLGLESYQGAWRLQGNWRPGRANDRSLQAADLRADYYYRDQAWLGLYLAHGEESAIIADGGVQVYRVRSLGLLGQHPLTEDMSLRYGLERSCQGQFFCKTWIQAGVRYLF